MEKKEKIIRTRAVIDRLIEHFNARNMIHLAEILELHPQTFHNWSKRGTMNFEVLDYLVLNRGIDLQWILYGKKPVKMGFIDDTTEIDFIMIEKLDIDFSAGTGTYPDEHALGIGKRAFAKSWIEKKGLQADNLKLVRVKGDSMEPMIRDKDLIMIDTSKTRPSSAMPTAFRMNEDLFIKDYQPQTDGTWHMLSKNPQYKPMIFNPKQPPEDFQILGAVVWTSHSYI